MNQTTQEMPKREELASVDGHVQTGKADVTVRAATVAARCSRVHRRANLTPSMRTTPLSPSGTTGQSPVGADSIRSDRTTPSSAILIPLPATALPTQYYFFYGFNIIP